MAQSTMISRVKRTLFVGFFVAGVVAAVAPKAEAGTASGTFNVTTQVQSACTLTTADLVFPDYTVGQSADDDAATAVTVNCPGASAGSPVAAQLKLATVSAAFAMTSGANTLPYSLYQDAARTTAFANNTNVNVSVTNTTQPVNVYGRIAANLTPPTGAYTQQVTATLTF